MLILSVSTAVVFLIWDGEGEGLSTPWDPRFPRQPSCTQPGRADSGEMGALKEAPPWRAERPSALGSSSRDSQFNFLLLIVFYCCCLFSPFKES